MARAKYKIGTFVKVAEAEETAMHFGAVEEIHLTLAGTAYKITGLDTSIPESEIETGFREIAQRKTVKAPKRVSKKSKAANEERASA